MDPTPIFDGKLEELHVTVYSTNDDLGVASAAQAAELLNRAVEEHGDANAILATGNSQLTFLRALRGLPVKWDKISIFHMDEYVGLAPSHPASFPLFLKRHLLDFIHPKAFFPVASSRSGDAERVCQDYEALLRARRVDLCALGIGENGHLAFNDPPFADFHDARWVKVVKLDEASRRQQVGEGHFTSLPEVPTHAITLTIPALLAAQEVLALVPEARKADAVFRALRGPVTESCPASILRRAPQAHLFLDADSSQKVLSELVGT